VADGVEAETERASDSGSGRSASSEALAKARAARDASQKKKEQRAKARAEDAKLVEAAVAGDANAFRKLVERNQGRLFAVAFGMLRDRDEAADVVQDAFIKAHKKLSDFEGNAAFSTWIYRICVNLCIDKKRAQARRRSVDIDDVGQAALSEDSIYADVDIAPRLSSTNPLKNASNKELGGQIQAALAELSEDHRSVLLLREIDGMSYEEISQTLDIPRGTVMSRLFHARKNMQKLLRPVLGLEEEADLRGNIEGKDEA
jgi:RNA polymerase sigma-70 factor (ECF subfamily)